MPCQPPLTECFLYVMIFACGKKTDGWSSRWVLSDWKRSEGKAGTFRHTAGKWSADPDDKGNIPILKFLCLY